MAPVAMAVPYVAAIVPPPNIPRPVSATLEEALARVIATVPPEKRGSFTASASLQGATAEVAHKLSDNWTVSAYGAYWWQSGAREAGARIKGSW